MLQSWERIGHTRSFKQFERLVQTYVARKNAHILAAAAGEGLLFAGTPRGAFVRRSHCVEQPREIGQGIGISPEFVALLRDARIEMDAHVLAIAITSNTHNVRQFLVAPTVPQRVINVFVLSPKEHVALVPLEPPEHPDYYEYFEMRGSELDVALQHLRQQAWG